MDCGGICLPKAIKPLKKKKASKASIFLVFLLTGQIPGYMGRRTLSLTVNPRGPYQPSCPTAQRILSSGEEPGNETCEGQGRLTTHVGEPWEDAGTLPGAMPYPLQRGSREELTQGLGGWGGGQ